jgi:hypothetical protein
MTSRGPGPANQVRPARSSAQAGMGTP